MAFILSRLEFPLTTTLPYSAAWLALKNLLKTVGWVVTSSGDGISLFSTTGDIIGSAGAGAGGLQNNRAWFAIRAPNSANAFTFQNCDSTSSPTGSSWRIKWSPGGTFNIGGSANTTPSATVESVIEGGGTNGSPTGWGGILQGNATVFAVASTTAPYIFWLAGLSAVGTVGFSGVCFDSLTSCFTGDASPYVWVNGFSTNPLNTFVTGLPAKFFAPSATPSTLISTYSSRFCSSGADALGPNEYLTGASTTTGGGLAPDPISGDDIISPFAYFSTATGSTGWKGLSQNIFWRGVMRSTGSTHTVSSTRDRIYLGFVSLPWDGSVPSF